MLAWERGSTAFNRRNVAGARNRGLKLYRAQLRQSRTGGIMLIAQSGIKCGQCVERPHRAQRKHECWDVNDASSIGLSTFAAPSPETRMQSFARTVDYCRSILMGIRFPPLAHVINDGIPACAGRMERCRKREFSRKSC
jgi:hypothetical protein